MPAGLLFGSSDQLRHAMTMLAINNNANNAAGGIARHGAKFDVIGRCRYEELPHVCERVLRHGGAPLSELAR